MRLTSKQLQLQAIKLGVLSAIIGCATFVLIEQTRLTLKFGFGSEADLEFDALVFVFGSLLASLSTVVSSNLLAILLYNESSRAYHIQRLFSLEAFSVSLSESEFQF